MSDAKVVSEMKKAWTTWLVIAAILSYFAIFISVAHIAGSEISEPVSIYVHDHAYQLPYFVVKFYDGDMLYCLIFIPILLTGIVLFWTFLNWPETVEAAEEEKEKAEAIRSPQEVPVMDCICAMCETPHVKGMKDKIDKLRALCDKWNKVSGLVTPGGSEYIDDPDRVIEQVQRQQRFAVSVKAAKNDK